MVISKEHIPWCDTIDLPLSISIVSVTIKKGRNHGSMTRNPNHPNYVDDLIGDESEAFCEDVFYHYTSPEGVKGILFCEKAITLWFSRVEFLNDAEEGKEIFSFIDELLEEKDDNESKEFCEWVKSIQYTTSASFIKPHIVGSERSAEDESSFSRMDTYICCFSENEDALPLWNYYAIENDGGYNIGFDRTALNNLIKSYCNGKEYLVPNIYKVIYDDDKKKKILRRLLEDFERLFINPDEDKDSLRGLFNMLIQEIRYRFKSHHFSHEEEVRVTIQMPTEKEWNGHSVQVRSKSGFLIPYIVVDSINKNAIRTLRLSPSKYGKGENNLKIEVLKECLEKSGYSDVSIELSDIPLRY